MLNAILHKGKLVGLFSDYQKCKVMLEGLISNNFADRKNLEIKSYYDNSITTGEYNEDNEDTESSDILEEFTDNNTTDTPKKEIVKQQINKPTKEQIKEPNKELTEEDIKKKSEIQNSIFELKRKKEKLEESKRIYEVDVDLYKKFKKIKETNNKFEIPEMFIDKYELMDGLDKENKLCWENFNELYKAKKISTSFDKLFNEA
jgi:hypothetical protein